MLGMIQRDKWPDGAKGAVSAQYQTATELKLKKEEDKIKWLCIKKQFNKPLVSFSWRCRVNEMQRPLALKTVFIVMAASGKVPRK